MLSKLMNYRRKTRLAIASCIARSDYLEPGAYFIDPELKFFYKDDGPTIEFVNKVIKKNIYKTSTADSLKYKCKRALVPQKIRIGMGTTSDGFKGSVYLLSNRNSDEKDVKVFDIRNNRILTVYVGIESLKKKVADYAFFNPHFNIPKIMSFDYESKTCIEALVITKPKHTWTAQDYDRVIESIFMSYENYIDFCARTGSYSNDDLETILSRLKTDEVLEEMAISLERKIPPNLFEDKIPVVQQHGDLWLYNSMIGEDGKVYVIDWEYSGSYFLFYDIFWWMQNEAVYHDNFSYLSNYLAGKYDASFRNILSSMNRNFNTDERKGYLYAFLLEFLYRRALPIPEDARNEVKTRFSRLIEQIQKVGGS